MSNWEAPYITRVDLSISGLIVYFSDGRQALLRSETVYAMIPYGEVLVEPPPEPESGDTSE